MMAKKKTSKKFAVWLLEEGSQQRVDLLVELITREIPLRGIRVSGGQAVMIAINEAIERRESKK